MTNFKDEKEKAKALRKSSWWARRLQEGLCYYCQNVVPPEKATMDHIVPLSRGGKSTRGNLVLSCKACNTKKKDMTAVEWIQYLEGLSSRTDS